MPKTEKKRLEIRLQKDDYDAVKAFCDANGITKTALITNLILRNLPIAGFHKGKKLGLKKNQIGLNLSKKEITALQLRTIEQGYAKSTQYIYSLLASVLFGKAHLNQKELDVAMDTIAELNSIGRNLNQIARALNQSENWEDETPEQLDAINKQIDSTLRDIKNLGKQIKQYKQEILNLVISGQERFKNN